MTSRVSHMHVVLPLLVGTQFCLPTTDIAADAQPGPWPASVPGFVAVQSGEHPRLFFRRSDVPELRKRAKTPEGVAILARLKVLLGGGEAMPTSYSPAKQGYSSVDSSKLPLGTYTLWHGAGFGLLYQVTGDKKGSGHLKSSLREYCLKPNMPPRSNHFGMEVGGAALAVLAVMGDEGVDEKLVKQYLAGLEKNLILTLSSDGKHPEAKVEGDKVVVGGQTIGCDGEKIIFAEMAGPPRVNP